MEEEEKRKRGRPKGTEKLIDIEELKRWARAGATIQEAAQRLGISDVTLDNRLARPKYRNAWKSAQAELKISLRSKQVQMALAGNVTMLVWLGKQFLGQKDKQEISGTGPEGAIDLNVSSAAEILESRIIQLAARRVEDESPQIPQA